MTTENQIQEGWIRKHWRPAIGVTYIVINIADFVIFPVLWTLAHMFTGADISGWDPLTLKAGGLFHVAYGAILGVSAWSRGQEKIAGVSEK